MWRISRSWKTCDRNEGIYEAMDTDRDRKSDRSARSNDIQAALVLIPVDESAPDEISPLFQATNIGINIRKAWSSGMQS
jgi:hypothetical protein